MGEGPFAEVADNKNQHRIKSQCGIWEDPINMHRRRGAQMERIRSVKSATRRRTQPIINMWK